jgi:hypothetical protein
VQKDELFSIHRFFGIDWNFIEILAQVFRRKAIDKLFQDLKIYFPAIKQEKTPLIL